MKHLLIALFLFTSVAGDIKDHTSSTGLYHIKIPDTWFVTVTGKWGEEYLKKGEYKGDFNIDVRPFLRKADAKESYYDLLLTYKEAKLTRLNDVEVVICSGKYEGAQEYNWIFYHDKYEVWCQYKLDPNALDEAELAEVTKAIESIIFFEVE